MKFSFCGGKIYIQIRGEKNYGHKNEEDLWELLSKIEIHNHSLPAEGDINEVLLKTLAEAHANTNIKLEIVHEMFRKPQVRTAYTSRQHELNVIWFLSFSGYQHDSHIQEHEQGELMDGLRWKIDCDDSEHHWICETHTWIHATHSRWSGETEIESLTLILILIEFIASNRFFFWKPALLSLR